MSKISRILVRLEDPEFARALAEQIDATADLASVAEDPAGPPPDLILLDADRLAQRGDAGCPVLGLGCLPQGSEDEERCIKVPVRIVDLLHRMRTLLQETRRERARFRIGRIAFDAEAQELSDSEGRKLRLPGKESAALVYLCRADGRSVSRAELLKAIWGYAESVESHTVETHVSRLRSSLRKAGAGEPLHTERGSYRLDCEPEEIGY